MTLTDPQAYALIRAILSAKFQTTDSTVMLGLPALDEILAQLLARDWADPNLARLVAGYPSEVSHPAGFQTVLHRLQIEIDGGQLQPEAEAVTARLAMLLYPYRPAQTLTKYYIEQLI
jgi:hypothetical protein